MSSIPVMQSVQSAREPIVTASGPIAPWWHTVLVLLPIAIGSVAGYYQHGLPNANFPA